MTYKIYGIKSCDTMKKTFDWLKAENVDFQFHDYKKEGIDRATLENWTSQADWKVLLNTKGTTWKKTDKETQEKVQDASSAIDFLLENTSAIKRPVITLNNKIIDIGFNKKLN